VHIKEILGHCDHTLLAQCATWEEIRAVLDDGMRYGTASVCLPPSYVKQAKEYVGNNLAICTVIGFPNGYNTTSVKCFECEEALKDGADEIDMVINLGWLRDKRYSEIEKEICFLKQICKDKVLKVIIETCLLSEEEKIEMCRIVTDAGADYIKTSTGFSKWGATKEDVALMVKHVGKNVKVKAAGGISDLNDAEAFLALGAHRLGTSRVVKAVKAANKEF